MSHMGKEAIKELNRNKTQISKERIIKVIDMRIEANLKVKSLSVARERNDSLRCLKHELGLNSET